MAYKQALSEGELHSTNYKSLRLWFATNKGKLRAPPNRTILYSGRDYDLEVLKNKLGKVISLEEREIFMGTQMYKVAERFQKNANKMRDANIGVGFKTLVDVLKTLKPPVIVDKDRREFAYPNAWVFFDELGKLKDLDPVLPNRKKIAEDAWEELSDTWASNAVGEIKIFAGAADDYDMLQKDKDFVMKELPALMRNPNLSTQAKDLLAKEIGAFGSYFDQRYRELIKYVQDGREKLKPLK